MYAGTGECGAEDAWYDAAVQFETWELGGESYVGGTTDIIKCFDQVNRQLLHRVLTRMGLPEDILQAYKR